MEANQLPTKPGPYCWRESDGHEWELVTLCGYCVGIGRLWCPTKRAFHDDMQGQWLPVPTAEELVELQAKAKAYDEGQEAWAVKCPAGQFAYTGTQDECSRKCVDLNAADMFLDGQEYTCRKVRVCKEVER
jgi:hypothetical protein